MPENSAFGKALIYTSAGIGVVIGGFQLVDRFGSQSPVLDQAEVTQTETVTEIAVAPKPDQTTNETTSTSGSVPILSELEMDLSARIRDMLEVDCPDIALREVSAEAQVTSAANSTSGLDGYYVEGEVVLVADNRPHRIRLVGTGKGPDGARAARAMAVRGLQDQIGTSDALKEFCKEN